jgi:hypothetical protein
MGCCVIAAEKSIKSMVPLLIADWMRVKLKGLGLHKKLWNLIGIGAGEML